MFAGSGGGPCAFAWNVGSDFPDLYVARAHLWGDLDPPLNRGPLHVLIPLPLFVELAPVSLLAAV